MTERGRIVIAVDGLAGSGKTSISKALAARAGCVHMSTGMLYRAVGTLALRAGIDPRDAAALEAEIKRHRAELRLGPDRSSQVWLDGENISALIYTPKVSEATSVVSQHRVVRAGLVDAQRRAFPGQDMVAEGRDMGTVIFPDAAVKFFIQTAPEVRVERRMAQLYGDVSGFSQDQLNRLKKELEVEVLERDERDANRALAPTVPAEDAILVDNSTEKLTKVVESMYDALVFRGLVRKPAG